MFILYNVVTAKLNQIFHIFNHKMNLNIRNYKRDAGPLLFVLDEAPLQHKILNFGLFQAKTYANGL